jgi:hypothetical protein
MFRELGNRIGEANALKDLGIVRDFAGDHPTATTALADAWELYRDIGDRLGQAQVLNQCAAMHLRDGDPARARDRYRQALEHARAVHSSLEQAQALEGMGRCAPARTAEAELTEALAIYRRISHAHASRLAAELRGCPTVRIEPAAPDDRGGATSCSAPGSPPPGGVHR